MRQAFLCGKDRFSGRDFGHRRAWLERRLAFVASVFSIDLLAYAIMHNHYHVVVRIDNESVATWTDEQVIKSWGKLFRLPDGDVEPAKIALWRQRLCDLGWFMRCLNEPLARIANKEDGCKGRFWEGRYQLQALLDERALLRCMAYVDLNPIRATIANDPESSLHTSIRARIQGNDQHLMPFSSSKLITSPLPISRHEYLALVDFTGRELQFGKRGRIPPGLPSIMQRLGLEPAEWLAEVTHFGQWYFRAVGPLHKFDAYCQYLGQRWLRGRRRCGALSGAGGLRCLT
ncbi:MAG: transposase [Woeseiaceae bacterium]|nr:transposase [Woeseiaceae bacterium]